MTRAIDFTFTEKGEAAEGLAVLLQAGEGGLAGPAEGLGSRDGFMRAGAIAGFKGASMKTLDLIAPEGANVDRVLLVGTGDAAGFAAHDWLRLGGTVAGALGRAEAVTVFLSAPGFSPDARNAADFALGMLMRAYSFDTYKTTSRDEDADDGASDAAVDVTIVFTDAEAARTAFEAERSVGEGVTLARDLVNEPANILGTEEFAERAKALEKLGVEVEVLGEAEMRELGMQALLGVAQGSSRPPRLAIMQWKGTQTQPVAFIGKGVVFDSGGISIKPGASMEDMKGDMGGAAAVTGLMHTLAARKAKVNAVGIIGLVENMPDGHAQRPGDIVTSMSGQTIEIINTDAEGRLVLCDALWYCQDRFKPQFMVNLATLTGAIIVALGHHHAGLFSNDDTLADRLTKAGLATHEKLWRLPLGPEYDKQIESKFADMKHTGGRAGGSITAAQFLQRFVNETPWAHLDIAGTGFGSPSSEINRSWGSGFGVRLLDELVRADYEN
ncbi:leucyl aminopeptidase [Pararhizobium mangrovi]|uniref:Probable cytosol aminopeptidase n=1 Tax=Pararhizobium mangrovi TaxID=2590452 RepID=A0A506UGB0_9HYPH|nr:leucyl aminopeptidase [Pararhizobium mangrovi]TPW32049.1 leucyl aminopeptidase [Pararhizobium mangrovi]